MILFAAARRASTSTNRQCWANIARNASSEPKPPSVNLIKVKLLTYMSQRIGEQLDAVVTGVERFGLFVMGTDLPAEGLIHISSMQDDKYRFDANTHSLTGFREGNSYRLGDLIRVEVAHVDTDRRELDFRLVAANQKQNTKQPPKTGKPPRDSWGKAPNAKKPDKKSDRKKKGKSKGGRKETLRPPWTRLRELLRLPKRLRLPKIQRISTVIGPMWGISRIR